MSYKPAKEITQLTYGGMVMKLLLNYWENGSDDMYW